MEGSNVRLCNWKKVGKKFKLWLEQQPELVVENPDFEDGAEALAEKIADFYHDQEAVVEFKPPPPLNKTSPGVEIVSLGFNESVDALNVSSELFTGGFCENCRTPLGPRTDRQLQIGKPPKNDVAGIQDTRIGSKIFSEKFISLLSHEDKANLELRNVKFQNQSHVSYFELVGNPLALFIGVKRATYSPLSCSKCLKCGSARIFPRMPPGKLFRFHKFICSKDLPTSVPSCFVLGRPGMLLDLCMPLQRWKQTVGKPGTKGIATSPIGIIGEDQADYDPPLPIYNKK